MEVVPLPLEPLADDDAVMAVPYVTYKLIHFVQSFITLFLFNTTLDM